MKKALYIVVGLLFSLNLLAQEQQVIEKRLALPQGKRLDLDLKFGSDINISTWNKPEVKFNAIISYDEPGIEKTHLLDIQDTGSRLNIVTDYDFDKRKAMEWECNQTNRDTYNEERYCIKVRYELVLPQNALVDLKTISGNIEVKGFEGELRAKTISGFVDVTLEPSHQTKLKFRSVTGEIYTDFDIELDRNSNSYSKNLSTEINGGGKGIIFLETVSGNIFFRKS